ncbi:MAG TPA: Na-translocating system protein MpsC family protein [Solirubrobacteraceae bacterium]|jgi:uncharacterized protein YbcI|nr:Na-translocating system protein MpsC family protein [Solirubrobacteraceae bacterium]
MSDNNIHPGGPEPAEWRVQEVARDAARVRRSPGRRRARLGDAPARPAAPKAADLAALSRSVAAIYKRTHGRAPTRTRSLLADDVLTIVLEGILTRGQQTLVEAGSVQEVALARRAIQRALHGELRAAVQSHLTWSVRSVTSACDPTHGIETDVFLLLPPGTTGANIPARLAE